MFNMILTPMANLLAKTPSWFSKIVDFITGLFAIIPQLIYFIYTSCASFLDLLQYLVRKLAGLDVHYVNGQPKTDDIILTFIRGILGIDKDPAYSALSTVFWSLVIFGCILLVLTTIFSIIKAHYNYDAKKSHPFTIIGASLKHLALMVIVPIVAVFGLYLSQLLLQTLDEITSNSSSVASAFEDYEGEDGTMKNVLSESFEAGYINPNDTSEGSKVYASYDFFGSIAYTNTATFSGVMFKTAAYNCNRVRAGSYSTPTSKDFTKWDNFGVFYSTKAGDLATEAVATQIDYAFANTLTLKPEYAQTIGIYSDIKNNDLDWKFEEEDTALISSYMYGYGAVINVGLVNVKTFSKFNVGLVFYYYNLWGFNFLIAFAGIFAFITVLGNIVFGLITRLIQMLALFFVFPPLIGIAPLDDGKAFKEWRKQFIADTIMAFGAIIGMNIFFLILPFLNTISFFNVALLDNIMNIIIMIAGLSMVGKLIGMISGFIGGSDAHKVGEETKKATGELGAKMLDAGLKAANVGIKVGAGPAKFFGGLIGGPMNMIRSKTSGYMSRSARDARFLAKHGGGKSESEYVSEALASGKTAADGRALYQKDRDAIEARLDRRTKREQFATKAKGMVKTVGQTTAKGLTIALAPFGAKFEKGDDGKLDGVKSLKATGRAFLELGGESIKLGAGALLKGKDLYKKADEKGVIDSAKTAAKTFFNEAGIKNEQFESKFRTKKEKEDDEKRDLEKERQDMAEINNNSKLQLQELRKITSTLEN